MTNLDSIFKSRDVTLPTKVRLVKAMVFEDLGLFSTILEPLGAPRAKTCIRAALDLNLAFISPGKLWI